MTMAEVYYKLIKAGRKTIEEVPINIRTDVQAILDKDVTVTSEAFIAEKE